LKKAKDIIIEIEEEISEYCNDIKLREHLIKNSKENIASCEERIIENIREIEILEKLLKAGPK
jgi:hypothetical protein